MGSILGILSGGMPPGSPNADPTSDKNGIFQTRFQTWPLGNYIIGCLYTRLLSKTSELLSFT